MRTCSVISGIYAKRTSDPSNIPRTQSPAEDRSHRSRALSGPDRQRTGRPGSGRNVLIEALPQAQKHGDISHGRQSGQQTPDGWIITGTDRKNDLVDQ